MEQQLTFYSYQAARHAEKQNIGLKHIKLNLTNGTYSEKPQQ